MNIEDILNILPHRYPMLLVDKVVEFEKSTRIITVKNVSINENFFVGHFPQKPIMPGVLIIEAMAQSAAILAIKSMGEKMNNSVVYFLSIEDAKFRKPVIPGDVLKMETVVTKIRGNICKFNCFATVGEQRVAECKLSAMIDDKKTQK